MPNFRQRKWLLGAIAIAIIILLSLIAAPSGNKGGNGSTYERAPSGYGGWYEYMLKKEAPIQRWQKPFNQLNKDNSFNAAYIRVATDINYQISSTRLSKAERSWLEKGNIMIILGVNQPATAAPFNSFLTYRESTLSSSSIEIATTRRYKAKKSEQSLLSDRFGTVVWSQRVGEGKVIYSTTPYLAANAYQYPIDNYEFLAGLIPPNQKIYVDEYIRGYKDQETIEQENAEGNAQTSVLDYLAQTSWYLLFIQLVIILSIAAITAFRRFGQPTAAKATVIDNSTAYIDALAGVLEKATSTDFVVNTIQKDEQRKLQTSLGLGKSLVDQDTLIAAWEQQKTEPATELKQLLAVKSDRKISDAQLIAWVEKWQNLNQHN